MKLNKKKLILIKFSKIDKDILFLYKSTIKNYLMSPIIGSIDTYVISKLSNEYALSGQGSADKLYNSIFNIISFAPSIITPYISKYDSYNDNEKVIEITSSCYFLVSCISIFSTFLIFTNKNFILKQFIPNSKLIYDYSNLYFQFRLLGLPFGILNSISSSVMRGRKNLKTPLRINLISQILNCILDPILILKFGIKGAGIGVP